MALRRRLQTAATVTPVLALALAIRFSLEICLAAVAAWLPSQILAGREALGLSAALVIFLVLIWGALLSPKRHLEIGALPRLLLEMLLFGLAAIALYSNGQRQLAFALIGIAAIDKVALVLLERRV